MLWARASVLLFALVTVGCQGGPPPAYPRPPFEDVKKLGLTLQQAPSSTFDFCATPSGPLHLGNATWLAFMAANEYAHLGYLAPVLNELGFYRPGGIDQSWTQCAFDLQWVRAFEKIHADDLKARHEAGPEAMKRYLEQFTDPAHPEVFGQCLRRWFIYEDYDGSAYPAAAFEGFLVQETDDSRYLQFFSGGEFTLSGDDFKEGSTQVFFARHRRKPVAIVSFRGTEPGKWSDVGVDAKMWHHSLEEEGWSAGWGRVHDGFFDAFNTVADGRLMAKIRGLHGSPVGIWITGHSLGGALATVTAARLLEEMEAGTPHPLRGVYTFGSPRVGDEAFRDRFTELARKHGVKVVRVRNGRDLVTNVPGLLMEYAHVGLLVHLTDEGLTVIEDPEAEPGHGLMGGSIGDHNMTGYDGEGQPVSGYYRRLLEALNERAGAGADDPLLRCETDETSPP